MLYLRRSDGALVTFNGMTQEQVVAMLATQNLSGQFLTQAEYNAAVKV